MAWDEPAYVLNAGRSILDRSQHLQPDIRVSITDIWVVADKQEIAHEDNIIVGQIEDGVTAGMRA